MKKLISDTNKYAKRNGIKIALIKKKQVVCNGETMKTNGYFDSEARKLVVAVDKPDSEWQPIFIHESCHMEQFIENPFLWEKWNVGFTHFFTWLEGGMELDEKTLLMSYQDIVDCELDCEKRAVQKIIKYGIDIDIKKYKKMSNLYLYSYAYVMASKKWKTGIYHNQELLKCTPTPFQKSYLLIPPKLKVLLDKFYS